MYCLVRADHSDTQHYAYNEQLELQHGIKRTELTKQIKEKIKTQQKLAWALEIATLFLFRSNANSSTLRRKLIFRILKYTH